MGKLYASPRSLWWLFAFGSLESWYHEKVVGLDHKSTMDIVNNLRFLHAHQGNLQLQEIERMYEQAPAVIGRKLTKL